MQKTADLQLLQLAKELILHVLSTACPKQRPQLIQHAAKHAFQAHELGQSLLQCCGEL